MPEPQFRIRTAGDHPDDADFIVSAFDSTLPHLAATGNSGQWGTQPFSEKEGFLQATRDDVAQAERFRTMGEGERIRMFIAEVVVGTEQVGEESQEGLHRRIDEDGKTLVAVGAVTIRDEHFAQHVVSLDVLKPHVAKAERQGNFMFLDVLITDYRVGSLRRGSGAALVKYVRDHAKEKNKGAIWIDVWTGGTDTLLRYYERLGFAAVADFAITKKDGSTWPGMLMRMDV